jgi:hypothetical protein
LLRKSPSTSGRPNLPVKLESSNGRRGRRHRVRRSTTPDRLRLLQALILVGSCLLWFVGGAALITARAEVDSFGHRTAPAVATALRLHAYLADADRLAANDFLLGAQGSNEKRQEYELEIATAVREMERAAELNGPAGQAGEQLQQIGAMLIQYTGLVEMARANARPPSPGAAYLRQASALMHRPGDGILARVDTLANPSLDDRAMDETRMRILRGTMAAFFVGALGLLGLLIYTQLFLRRRFRRRSSPPILAAMFLLIALSAWMASLSSTTYRNLSIAEGVTYAELHRLSLMRSLAADANADESLALITRGDTGRLQNDFNVTTEQIVNPDLNDDAADAAVRGDVRFSGLMADEFQDATSSDDRAAAKRVLRGYQEFLAMDASFRAKAMTGKYDDATALVVGAAQSGTAYADLSIALEQRVDVEQARFDAAVADARPGLNADVGMGLGAAAIALLVLVALRPRIAEYSGTTMLEQGRGWRRLRQP